MMTTDLESLLEEAVSQCDLQACLSLLAQGACVNIPGPGQHHTLLHHALSCCAHPQQYNLAMVQLLLINGADPASRDSEGRTVLDLALKQEMRDVVELLQGWGAGPGRVEVDLPDITVKFHRYVFLQEEEEGGKENMAPPTPRRGKEFLEQVADIFLDNLEGVGPGEDQGSQGKTDTELATVFTQLGDIGFRTPVNPPTGPNRSLGSSFVCSTPRRGRPRLDVSQISSIRPYDTHRPGDSMVSRLLVPSADVSMLSQSSTPSRVATPSLETDTGSSRRLRRPYLGRDTASSLAKKRLKISNCGEDKVKSSTVSTPGKNKNHEKNFHSSKDITESVSDKSATSETSKEDQEGTFLSCRSDLEDAAQRLASSSLLSVCQEYILTDGEVSLVEKRLPSVLGLALQDQEVLDHLQEQSEQLVGPQTPFNLSRGDSFPTFELREELGKFGELPSGPITSQTKRSYLLRLKKLRLGLEVPHCSLDKYPAPMASSLKNVSSVTRDWEQLMKLEQEMAGKFSNIPDEVATSVNFLTRETVCKSSFNYLLLDPRLTQNLPLKVFSSSDQELWRIFVSSIFYVGKGTRSRPFQHLYEAVKQQRNPPKKGTSAKIATIHSIWEAGSGVVVVQVFHNTIAVESFTREAAMISAVGVDNLTNVAGGDYYGPAAMWPEDEKLRLGTLLVFKAFKIFLQEGERQIRPVDLRLGAGTGLS